MRWRVSEGRWSRNDKLKQPKRLFPGVLSLASTEQEGRRAEKGEVVAGRD